MSPRRFTGPPTDSVEAALRRAWFLVGERVRDARLSRRWPVATLAQRAGVSTRSVYLVEAGESASVETVVRLGTALGLRLEVELIDPRRRQDRAVRTIDPVHSFMGEFEARHLRALGYPVGIDEPYQHYQFAGRGDLVAWDLEVRALLHLENRTRFPDLQETAGSFNSKRAYLGAEIAKRIGVRGWASETHVLVALWSAEVLHTLRLRPESFRSICGDPPDEFQKWWAGRPLDRGVISALVVLDPLASGRQRVFVGLEDAIETARPRHRGYADVVAKLAEGA